ARAARVHAALRRARDRRLHRWDVRGRAGTPAPRGARSAALPRGAERHRAAGGRRAAVAARAVTHAGVRVGPRAAPEWPAQMVDSDFTPRSRSVLERDEPDQPAVRRG